MDSMDQLAHLMEMPVEDLRRRARTRFRLLPDNASLLADFAHSIADEIREHNRRGEPTRLILPVGPISPTARWSRSLTASA